MVAALVDDINGCDADSKAPSLAVKSEPVDVEYDEKDTIQPTVTASRDSDSGSSRYNSADDVVHFAQDEHGDTTECSSPFGDSTFGSDDDAASDAGLVEVDSPFFSQINMDDSTVAPHIVRKKNVTADWRRFIGPERWRCQWLELRMKDLLSQVAKYDKELALINHEKHLQMEMLKADNSKSELSQLELPGYERNTMNRRKRKRYKDDVDTLLYFKKHHFFSYYNHENKKTRTENEKGGAGNEFLGFDDFNNLDVEDTTNSIGSNGTLLESQGYDTLLEQHYLREILSEIEYMQSRIINIRSHLSEAYNKIGHTQKSQKKGSHGLDSKKTLDTPFGAAEDETTVQMLFGVSSSLIDLHIESICKESFDDVLIDNEAAIEEEFCQFERIKRTDKTCSEPIKDAADAQIIELVKKRGPKPKRNTGASSIKCTKSKRQIRKVKRYP